MISYSIYFRKSVPCWLGPIKPRTVTHTATLQSKTFHTFQIPIIQKQDIVLTGVLQCPCSFFPFTKQERSAKDECPCGNGAKIDLFLKSGFVYAALRRKLTVSPDRHMEEQLYGKNTRTQVVPRWEVILVIFFCWFCVCVLFLLRGSKEGFYFKKRIVWLFFVSATSKDGWWLWLGKNTAVRTWIQFPVTTINLIFSISYWITL